MYLSEGTKGEIVSVIEEVKERYKVTEAYCCRSIELCPKRYKRWIKRFKETGRYGGGRPGPKVAPHALMEEERQSVVKMLKKEEYADLSHRQLSVVASEEGIVEASASTIYREMKKEGLQNSTMRREVKKKQNKPEIEPQKPNEVWSWDLTYIELDFGFVYLFAIIDVFSRKMVGWHLSINATIESMKVAWDNALRKEGLIGVIDVPKMPIALSDHGVQMAKKTAKQFFRDLGINQLFARYQTPKDNAWIESWFRILKHDWLKYKDYVTFDELRVMLETFIEYYNNKRYHGAIGYVTPSQKHNGEAEKILAERRARKQRARLKRLNINRNKRVVCKDIHNQEQLKYVA